MQAPISYEALTGRIRDIRWMLAEAASEESLWRAWGTDTELGVRLTIGRSWDPKDWGLWLGFFAPGRDIEPHGHGYPFWTVVGIYRGTDGHSLAQDILHELERQVALSKGWREAV